MFKQDQLDALVTASGEVNYREDYSYLHVCYDVNNDDIIYIKTRGESHNSEINRVDKSVRFLLNIDEKITRARLEVILEKLKYAFSHPL